MGITRYIFIFLFFCSIAQASSTEAVTVLLYGDQKTFDPYMAGREIRHLKKNFGLPVLAYSIDNAEALRSTLLQLTRNKTQIKNLIVRGLHGGTYESVPSFEVTDNSNDDFENVGFVTLQEAGVHLNFTADTFIFFDSCTMIEKTTVESMKIAFNEVRKIGFQSGTVYMNHEEGAYGTEIGGTIPFYAREGSVGKKAQQAAIQAIWYVTLPYFWYLDHYKYNHGFLWQVSGNHEAIFATHAYKVQDGAVVGKLIYSK
jgi:hypothetical protein